MAEADTIGLLETSSVARGYEAVDAMLKAAPVTLLIARTICSGKYLAAVTGDVASVQAGVRAGAAAAEGSVIEQGVIPRLHPAIFPAVGQSVVLEKDEVGALGILETFSAASIIHGADAAVKAADVTLFRIHMAMALGGKAFALVTGKLGDVQAAVEAGARACGGMLASKVVIPSPHKDLFGDYL